MGRICSRRVPILPFQNSPLEIYLERVVPLANWYPKLVYFIWIFHKTQVQNCRNKFCLHDFEKLPICSSIQHAPSQKMSIPKWKKMLIRNKLFPLRVDPYWKRGISHFPQSCLPCKALYVSKDYSKYISLLKLYLHCPITLRNLCHEHLDKAHFTYG